LPDGLLAAAKPPASRDVATEDLMGTVTQQEYSTPELVPIPTLREFAL
jgi:hypothetical protein